MLTCCKGAGQAGLTAHARLKMLNVPTLIIDKNDTVGDNWRKRYHQLVLHDPVWYDHLPYMNFPDYWPVFAPKDKLAEWFEGYAKALELNIWMRSSIESASWNEVKKLWTVKVTCQDPSAPQRHVLHTRSTLSKQPATRISRISQISRVEMASKATYLPIPLTSPGQEMRAMARKLS